MRSRYDTLAASTSALLAVSASRPASAGQPRQSATLPRPNVSRHYPDSDLDVWTHARNKKVRGQGRREFY